ncbi:ATP-binding protein [Temperatibacter marinus]|uniref:Sensory/regulatory protein RpfC n=1 Tax=Temperatibacter marinus TaxID=1456591 RepID=A0AA52HAA8_9PROT|nr:ATP-binding protein [Temperatibacter marinus]WND04056.1 ATP-binding protein [Temperatibacter marinus]
MAADAPLSLDLIPTAVLQINTAGQILYANQIMGHLVGYEEVEYLMTLPLANLLFKKNGFHSFDDLPSLFGPIGQEALKRRDGQAVAVSVTYSCNEETAILCFTPAEKIQAHCRSINTQLDEFKNYVSDLQFTQDALEAQGAELARISEEIGHARDLANEANRAKSEFLATMSHELRTPLNGILGMTSMLLNSKIEKHLRENILTIADSGAMLLELLNDILDLSKIEAGHLDLELIGFDLHHLLTQVETLWRPKIEMKGLHFSVSIDQTVPQFIHSDPTRIRQLLTNLINNASKFTHSGSIKINIVQARAGNQAGHLIFSVADTGIGIPKDKLESLFEKFTQADSSTTRQYGGTGLGLAICHQLTELMGGHIDVKSKEGQGSEFSFEIPYTLSEKDKIITLQGEDHLENLPAFMDISLLIAEDNLVNQTVICKILENHIREIDLAGNGLEVLEKLEQGNVYDLILMDIQMPEMDGLEATQKLRQSPDEKAANIPIIALTANAMAGDREYYLKNGLTGYASKPIVMQDLLMEIYRHLTDQEKASFNKPTTDSLSENSSKLAPSAPASKKEQAMDDILACL